VGRDGPRVVDRGGTSVSDTLEPAHTRSLIRFHTELKSEWRDLLSNESLDGFRGR